MSRIPFLPLVAVTCLLASLPAHAAPKPPAFPRYYADLSEHSDFPSFIELRADGTYSAKLDGNQVGGFYDIRGSKLILHIQNQGDVTTLYRPTEIRIPGSSDYQVFTKTTKPFIPNEFVGLWTGRTIGSREPSKNWVRINADQTCHVHYENWGEAKSLIDYDGEIVVTPEPVFRSHRTLDGPVYYIRGYSLRIYSSPGSTSHGTIHLNEPPSPTPRNFKLAIFFASAETAVEFTKPYRKGNPPMLTAVMEKPHTKPKVKPRPVDTFGANGVGD